MQDFLRAVRESLASFPLGLSRDMRLNSLLLFEGVLGVLLLSTVGEVGSSSSGIDDPSDQRDSHGGTQSVFWSRAGEGKLCNPDSAAVGKTFVSVSASPFVVMTAGMCHADSGVVRYADELGDVGPDENVVVVGDGTVYSDSPREVEREWGCII